MYLYQEQLFEYIPERIRLQDGMTRTSLNELSVEQQEELGLFYYQDVIPEYNSAIQKLSDEKIIDHNLKTVTRTVVNIPIDQLKETINSECQLLILEKFSLIHQIDVNSGLYADKGMKQWISNMVKESNRCSDLIDINQAATPAWPIYTEVI